MNPERPADYDIATGLDAPSVVLRKSPRARRFSSTRGGASQLDGRSSEAQYLRRARRKLTEFVGDNPSTIQAALIERLAWLSLHLAKIDQRVIEKGRMSDIARREYLAWANAYSRMLIRLGTTQTDPPDAPPSLEELFADDLLDGPPDA